MVVSEHQQPLTAKELDWGRDYHAALWRQLAPAGKWLRAALTSRGQEANLRVLLTAGKAFGPDPGFWDSGQAEIQ